MFSVLDAPDVSVLAHNTTVDSQTTTLTCVANGVPSTYRYTTWEHTWGWNTPLLRTFYGTKTLVLDKLTYEASGVYTCKAENGVRYSRNPIYGIGSAFLEVKGNTLSLRPF